MKIRRVVITILLFLLPALCFRVAAQTSDLNREELGVTRMQPAWPEDGATIDDPQPMIAADASRLQVPLDPRTVTLTLNGRDVTDAADITPAYVIYQPPDPLSPGLYDVRVTADDVQKNRIEPLSWSFRVSGAAPAEPEQKSPERDNTTGRFSLSTDYISSRYQPLQGFDLSRLFREKEGMKLNTDLFFSNVSEGRSLIGSFHRETRDYTDVEQDKGRLDYRDDNFAATLGSFHFRLSDLTVAGAELLGARVTTSRGPWDLTLFSGRSQDPSIDGTFRQLTSGVSGALHWNSRHTTTLTALSAYETDDPVFRMYSAPARDEIAGLLHTFRAGRNVTATVEAAANTRRERGSAASHNGAYRIALAGAFRAVSGEIQAYSIDDSFLPVAEGSARYLLNDRKGVRARAAWAISGMFTVGGEYEEYDTDSTQINTTRHDVYVTLKRGVLVPLTYRNSVLTTGTGVDSRSDSVTASLALPGFGAIKNPRISAGWQSIDYIATGAQSETAVQFVTFQAAIQSSLGVNAGYSRSDTDNILSAASTRTDSVTAGFTWSLIPSRLTWSARYELLRNANASIDNREERAESSIRYAFRNGYSMTMAYGAVSHVDTIAPDYDYDQEIVRAGMQMDF